MGFQVRVQQVASNIRKFVQFNKRPIVNVMIAILVVALIASLVAAVILSTRANFSCISKSVSAKFAVSMYSVSVVSAAGLSAVIIARNKMQSSDWSVLYLGDRVVFIKPNGVALV